MIIGPQWHKTLNLHFYPPSINAAFCFFASFRSLWSQNARQPNFTGAMG